MDKNTAHDILHTWNGGMAENCPVCNGDLENDKDIIKEAKSVAADNYTPKVNPDIPSKQVHPSMTRWAELDSADRKNLDAGSFAYIDSKGGKHLPIPDAAHVRNALARFNQTHFDDPADKPKAMAKIRAAAKKFGVKVSDEQKNTEVKTFVNLMSFAENGNLPTRFKILPTGTFKTRYGETKITYDDVVQMKKNFDEGLRNSSNTIGLPIDLEHGDTAMKDAAGAWMKKLDAQPDGLYADDVTYTSIGRQSLSEGIYKLFSPSFYLAGYVDPETGEEHDNVLTGGAFCNKPVLGHSLKPLVYSETADEKTLLTEDKNSSTVFIEITKTLHNMDLHEIAKTPKDKRTSEQQKFLSEHQDELTFAEAKAEGLVPAKETKAENKLAEGQVAVDAKEWSDTKAAAQAGKSAADELAKTKMEKEIRGLIENDEGIAVKVDQIPGMVNLAMNMSEDDRKVYFEQLKALPKQKLFKEEGSEKAVNMTDNPTATLSALVSGKVADAKKEGKSLDFSEAERQVLAENADLKSALQRGYTGGN